jgi:hypothetical protein
MFLSKNKFISLIFGCFLFVGLSSVHADWTKTRILDAPKSVQFETLDPGFPYISTVYTCNYSLPDLKCIQLDDLDTIEHYGVTRRQTLYSDLERCRQSCEYLFPTKTDLERDAQLLTENISSLFRILSADEIDEIKETYSVSRHMRRPSVGVGTVFGWIKDGSSAKFRAQYFSLAGSSALFKKKKYRDQEKYSGQNGEYQGSFVGLKLQKVLSLAKSARMQVRFPNRNDLIIMPAESDSDSKFPRIQVKIDPKAIIVVPMVYEEWQDFFMPSKYLYPSQTSNSEITENTHSLLGRRFALSDREVLLVASRLPINFFSLVTVTSPAFKELYKEKARQLVRRKKARQDHFLFQLSSFGELSFKKKPAADEGSSSSTSVGTSESRGTKRAQTSIPIDSDKPLRDPNPRHQKRARTKTHSRKLRDHEKGKEKETEEPEEEEQIIEPACTLNDFQTDFPLEIMPNPPEDKGHNEPLQALLRDFFGQDSEPSVNGFQVGIPSTPPGSPYLKVEQDPNEWLRSLLNSGN